MRPFTWSILALAAAGIPWAQNARADGATPPSKKRALPNYDGRGMPDVSRDSAAAWLARVLLSPLYLLSEYAIRRAVKAMTVTTEKHDVASDIYDFFAFGPDHKIGFVPTAFFELGFEPSIGVYFFGDDFVVPHNHVRMHVEGWPTDSVAATFRDRYDLGVRSEVELAVALRSRPDLTFYGTGPSTLESRQSRYAERRFDASVRFGSRVWRSSRFDAALGLRKVDVSNGRYGSDPSLEQQAATGAFPIPYGFGRSDTAPYGALHLALDTRAVGARRGSSFRVQADSEQGADRDDSIGAAWVRWGGSATARIDVDGRARILSFSTAASFADSLDDRPIPFTELVSLGGDEWMHGYFPGRLLGRSAAVGSVRYTWPIAPSIDATMQVAIGNVFGEHLEGFAPGLLRLSGSMGVTTGLADPPIQLLVGAGTETFDHGTQVDSVRVAIGVPRGF